MFSSIISFDRVAIIHNPPWQLKLFIYHQSVLLSQVKYQVDFNSLDPHAAPNYVVNSNLNQ